jgi:ribonuclease BN (tRNA processing enzyme)
MNGNKNSMLSDLVTVNQIVDLCIDQDLYDILEEIIIFSPSGSKNINIFRDEAKKKQEREQCIYITEIPVSRIVLSKSLLGDGNRLVTNSEIDLDGSDSELRSWSDLFWAKAIRAEIRKYNKDSWSKYYDQLIFFLETRMPKSNLDSDRIFFHFLMELSAAAFKEASYGYAERARLIIEKIITGDQKKDRDLYGTFYDRWVWYNMGLAYQHMGFHQLAVLDYNRVISKFMNWAKSSGRSYKEPNVALELLFDVIPSIHQRAEVSLQLQLGYHALQTVSEPLLGVDLDGCLRELANGSQTLIQRAASNILKNKSLLQLKALLQLMELEKAEDFCKNSIDSSIYGSPEFRWGSTMMSLPSCPSKTGQPPFRIKFIEESVTWFLEKANMLYGSINDLEPDILNDQIHCLVERMEAVREVYWNWVDDNFQDGMVYFSRWARLLNVSTNILKRISQLEMEDQIHELLHACLDFYLARRDKIPTTRDKRENHSRTLELENFKSDDLPDFANGLDAFYEIMSDILVRNESSKLKKAIEKYFETHNSGDPVAVFKEDHSQFLSALDEYEREFAENKRISALIRCNKRLIWNEKQRSEKGCESCMICTSEPKPVHLECFYGLLQCAGDYESSSEELLTSELQQKDYERIMDLAEEHMTHHLEDHSVQEPHKKSLHFVGLQRWNSETPAQGRSVGGGYFIYRTTDKGEVDFGIAIDPGFDFVRNLFRMGFSLKDVNIVLISHAHPDHIWDFESMVQLLKEAFSKGKKMHRLNVILSLGSYHRLQHIINNVKLRQFINPLVIDIRKELENNLDFLKLIQFYKNKLDEWSPILPGITNSFENPIVKITPTLAYHDDYTPQSDSFGFLIEFADIKSPIDNSNYFTFGYTGDTKWVSNDLYNDGCPIKSECEPEPLCHKDVAGQYLNCDVLLVHVGSLIDHKSKEPKKRLFNYYFGAEQCEKLIREKNHPYLMGIIRLMRNLHERSSKRTTGPSRLILVGEFGEEMRGGIRKDFIGRLRKGITPDWPVLPVDVGLDICLHEYDRGVEGQIFKFLCSICGKYHSLDAKTIRYTTFGQDEAIFYLCVTCDKSTPEDVRQDKLRQIYEIGKELRMLPN